MRKTRHRPLIDPAFGGDETAITAVSTQKQNPSIAGGTIRKHDPLWLAYEPEILIWWLNLGGQLSTAAPTIPNPKDSPLLTAEKEILVWWYVIARDCFVK